MAKKQSSQPKAEAEAKPKAPKKENPKKRWINPVYIREFGRQSQGEEVSAEIENKYPKFVELYAK